MSAAGSDGDIWLIGCGNMAGAMLRRWLGVGVPPARFSVVRPSGRPVGPGVRVLTRVPDEPPPAVLVLGFKPQQLDDVAPSLDGAAVNTVISILAGVRLDRLRAALPDAGNIVRAMPNLPVAIGRGVVGAVAERREDAIDALLAPLGLVEWLDDERAFDALTALAGSGPAFTYRFVEALEKGAVASGLNEVQAKRLALATVAGAADYAQRSEASLAALVDAVASRGGSTRAGLDRLDGPLDALIAATLAAAERRNHELGA